MLGQHVHVFLVYVGVLDQQHKLLQQLDSLHEQHLRDEQHVHQRQLQHATSVAQLFHAGDHWRGQQLLPDIEMLLWYQLNILDHIVHIAMRRTCFLVST